VTSFHKIILSFLMIGASAGFFCTQTQAAGPIKGQIDFIGTVSFGDNIGNVDVSLPSATRVATWISSFVSQDSLDFSSISSGTNVTMATPWIFNPSMNTPGLWSVGGFTFDLTSSVVVTQNSNFLNISGIGTVSSTNTNFSPTPSTWSFTVSSPNGGNSGTFGFQSNTAAVPEAGTAALLATGAFSLAGIQFLRRKHKYANIEVRK
jgi:hypothetical protein